ncbi:uncharacterized protein [Musca autumnalis]|uniref:uncharacterized protein n=1 Tax=Musca autumnalis TaxID=221902 RepID=UPI003CF0B422
MIAVDQINDEAKERRGKTGRDTGTTLAVYAKRTIRSARVIVSFSSHPTSATRLLAPDCPSLTACRRCDYRHHTLIHGAPQLDNSIQPPAPATVLKWNLVFVPTATIRVVGDDPYSWATLRALINKGASMSRISYSSFQRMGLRSFTFLGRRFTTFKIKARNLNATWTFKVHAFITDELPYNPYCDPIIEDPTRDFTGGSLADVDPRSNTPIELELGADTYSAIYQEGRTFSGVGGVYGYQTELGYVLAGPTRNLPLNSPY